MGIKIEIKPLILELKKIVKRDYNQIGSKAANLSKLIQNGFSIPNGFVVTTNAYLLFLNENKLNDLIQKEVSNVDNNNFKTIENCSKTIQEVIEKNPIPSILINEIKAAYSQLASGNVAVRSSATAEDLPTASFAGQYDTFLNLKNIEEVIKNIKSCYASVWTSRAISYRHKNKIPHLKVKIATIVQKMVPAISAGVLFTVNPITMNKSEIIIESNFGLGESIVSGLSTPDSYVIRREGKKGQKSFRIIDKQINKKKIAIHAKSSDIEGGIEHVNLSEEKGMQSSLSDTQIVQLAEIGIKVENYFKNPQDIEWAIDHDDQILLLQSRPITSLKGKKIDKDNDTFFSRGYSDDYWNDPCTPLYYDLLGDQLTKVVNMELNSIMGYKRMDDQLLKLYKGHIYFNLKVLKRKVEYEIPKFLRNEDLLNYFPRGTGPYGKETIKNYPFRLFKKLFSEIRIKIYDPDGSIAKTAEKYNEWSENEFLPHCNNFNSQLRELKGKNDAEALLNLADELDKIMVSHFRLVRYGIPVHNIGMNLMVQYLLTRFLGKEDSKRLFPVLISGLEHKLTETNDELQYLASIIQESPEVKSLILKYDSEKLYQYISTEKTPNIQVFFKEFKKFLDTYGDRGFTRESYYPRWSEAPKYVFDILKTLVMGLEDKKIDFKKLKAKNLHYREKIEKLVETKIRALRFGFIKWKLFKKILDYSRTYIVFREAQRFNLDRWITRNRNLYLEIGDLLVRYNVLKDATEIFFLHKREIKEILLENLSGATNIAASSLVKPRQEDFLKYEHTVPPKFLQNMREFDDKPQYKLNGMYFEGIPASQGIITGLVRVITRIEEILKVQTGEILILPRTDPGWTPVFFKIGGLITETGGVLSHGAVVSREYGIPAVTNIPNACKIFKTGQIITINGYDGSVTLKK